MKEDRRLIEDYLPIQAISAEASREKSVRKGHISTLHLWWARRPLVACRAAVYGALVPASRFTPPNATAAKAKSLGRANAAKFVERLCKYPGDPRIIAEAEQHILEAQAERLSAERGETVTVEDIRAGRAPRPRVLDMFAGGGAIPLEALRLGCEAYALDLNPVAHIIQLCTLVYPQTYGKPDPAQPGMTGPENAEGKPTWGGLAAEVRYWGDWVLERVRAEIGDLYPLIPDPNAEPQDLVEERQPSLIADDVRQQRLKTAGQYLTPVAYLWTRTVRCKNPDCGAEVPLVRQTWLKKEGPCIAVNLIAPVGKKRVQFKVVTSDDRDNLGFDPFSFSVSGSAACRFCKTLADDDYVKREGKAGQLNSQLMAVVCVRTKGRGKLYISGTPEIEGLLAKQPSEIRAEEVASKFGITVPSEPLEANPRSFDVQHYGFTKWRDVFTPRQLVAMTAFAGAIKESHAEMLGQICKDELAEAVAAYLSMVLGRLADYCTSFCTWQPEFIKDTFNSPGLPMVMDYAEANPLIKSSGSWQSALDYVLKAYEQFASVANYANVTRGSALATPYEDETFEAVITDPPYYDSRSYSNLSDHFYVWHKRAIGHIRKEHFSNALTPKRNEAIAAPYRHGGSRAAADAAYEGLMQKAFVEARRVLKPSMPMVVVYAHKTTAGWTTLINSLRQAWFVVVEAWPVQMERKARQNAQETGALASSILLVTYKRDTASVGDYEKEVRPDLERIVRERVETLWQMGIGGADLVIAAVGAGLRAFTRFARVEYANGEEVPPEKFLAEVEGVVLETLLEKIFGLSRSGFAGVDAASRFYVLWRYAYGARELEAGEAIVFAYPQSVELDGARGLTQGARALVEKKKNKYHLRDFTERGQREGLGLPDEERNAAPAPLIDALHRVLWLIENQPRTLPEFLARARPDVDRLRLIAQALAGPALKGGESETRTVTTTATEASTLGKLLANWRSLMEDKPLFGQAQNR